MNVIHYMNDFRSVLSYGTNIGFFFGAGTSCAFGLPSIGGLTTLVKENLSQDNQRLYIVVETSVRNLMKRDSVTVEEILNHLREIRELTRGSENHSFEGINGVQAADLDRTICRAIFDIIREKTKAADVSDLRRFFAWYDVANRGFLKEIYTTNYDMLLEMAMEYNFTPYFDGFVGSYEPFFSSESIENFVGESDSTRKWIRLWKIHGSLNWMKKAATSQTGERIIRVGRVDKPENELMIYPSREKYNLSRKEPYIAYFDRLKRYLGKGELVFIICGYSFGDEHINEIIFNALRGNSRLYIVVFCYGDSQVEAMASQVSVFSNLCVAGPTKVITNGIVKNWEYRENEESDIGSGTYWQDGRFILGDFKSLISFLVDNSGRKNVIEEMADAK